MDVPLSFNGREYRLTVEEVDELAGALDARGGLGDDTFSELAGRLREATAPPVSAVELQGHEAAAVALTLLSGGPPELQRFYRDYAGESQWPHVRFSSVVEHRIEPCFALKLGTWFYEDALRPLTGGIDEETGDDLPPRERDFAAQAAMNAAFAETASTWARLSARPLSDQRQIADEVLAWLRTAWEQADAEAAAADDEIASAAAGARAWALRRAALWLESCANRVRRPWEAPRHEA